MALLFSGAIFCKEIDQLWSKLLYYEDGLSLEDAPYFFLHEKGKSDSRLELEAEILAFKYENENKVGLIKEHPQCVFPARYKRLKALHLIQTQDLECPTFNEWKNGVAATGATLVFAAAYPNNPASSFGHLFLRFDSATIKHPLLQYSVAYNAMTTSDDSGLLYAWKGLTGGYQARFSMAPYYMKINEYDYIESRTLWEFSLNLSPEQVELLIDHFWELHAASYFDYFFLDENCAYYTARVLSLLFPDQKFEGGWQLYYLPIDLITALKKAGVIKSVKRRESFKEGLQKKIDANSAAVNKEYRDLRDKKIEVKSAKTESLDMAIDYFNIKKISKKGELSKNDNDYYYQLMTTRSQYPSTESYENTKEVMGLDWTKSHKIGTSISRDEFSFSTRIAGYDYQEKQPFYREFDRFELLTLSLNKKKDRKISFNTNVVDILSLTPISSLEKKPSWSVLFKTQSTNVNAEGKMGSSFLFADNTILYGLLGPSITYGRVFHLDLLPTIGVIKKFTDITLSLTLKEKIDLLSNIDRYQFQYDFSYYHCLKTNLISTLSFQREYKKALVRAELSYYF